MDLCEMHFFGNLVITIAVFVMLLSFIIKLKIDTQTHITRLDKDDNRIVKHVTEVVTEIVRLQKIVGDIIKREENK